MQQLQFFLSDSVWDVALAARRVELLRKEPATAPNDNGVLILDDTGDRKKGSATEHVGRQYLGSVGKLDNGIVGVTTLWADEQHYYLLHVLPYTPVYRELMSGSGLRKSSTKGEISEPCGPLMISCPYRRRKLFH